MYLFAILYYYGGGGGNPKSIWIGGLKEKNSNGHSSLCWPDLSQVLVTFPFTVSIWAVNTGRCNRLIAAVPSWRNQSHALPQIAAEHAAQIQLCFPHSLMHCFSSGLLCNTVAQTHKLFMNKFCICSITVNLIDRLKDSISNFFFYYF